MQVPIPSPYFLTEAKREYSGNLSRRFWIELIQNSQDAGATEITISRKGRTVIFKDNGKGMDRNTLTEGLLTFGGSIKSDNATGGFGKAKFLLLFSAESYCVKTRNLVVNGVSIDYDLSDQAEEYVHGTEMHITIPEGWPQEMEEFYDQLVYVLKRSTLPIKFTFNGEKLECAPTIPAVLNKKTAIIRQGDDKLGCIIRMNGLYMFEYNNGHHYFYDLVGKSVDVFTQNREGFRYNCEAYNEYHAFLSKLTENKQSGLHAQIAEQKYRKTDKVIEGFTFKGEDMPNKLSIRHKTIYAICVAVGEILGFPINKDNFGFYCDPYIRGKCEDGRVWINPTKFEGNEDGWKWELALTLKHECVHLFEGYGHNESFILSDEELTKKLLMKVGMIAPINARVKEIKDKVWPKARTEFKSFGGFGDFEDIEF